MLDHNGRPAEGFIESLESTISELRTELNDANTDYELLSGDFVQLKMDNDILRDRLTAWEPITKSYKSAASCEAYIECLEAAGKNLGDRVKELERQKAKLNWQVDFLEKELLLCHKIAGCTEDNCKANGRLCPASIPPITGEG